MAPPPHTPPRLTGDPQPKRRRVGARITLLDEDAFASSEPLPLDPPPSFDEAAALATHSAQAASSLPAAQDHYLPSSTPVSARVQGVPLSSGPLDYHSVLASIAPFGRPLRFGLLGVPPNGVFDQYESPRSVWSLVNDRGLSSLFGAPFLAWQWTGAPPSLSSLWCGPTECRALSTVTLVVVINKNNKKCPKTCNSPAID
jgi:hypothetical protein